MLVAHCTHIQWWIWEISQLAMFFKLLFPPVCCCHRSWSLLLYRVPLVIALLSWVTWIKLGTFTITLPNVIITVTYMQTPYVAPPLEYSMLQSLPAKRIYFEKKTCRIRWLSLGNPKFDSPCCKSPTFLPAMFPVHSNRLCSMGSLSCFVLFSLWGLDSHFSLTKLLCCIKTTAKRIEACLS